MDQQIVGQQAGKEAVLLALIASEHVYIEGPPGVAKTMLAETAAKSTGLSFFFYQMHRDTKLHELIGDAVIVREPQADGGELVRSLTRPGGILTAELCVLDDISRAPGEALNILLRLLNERQYNVSGEQEAWKLPLRTVIATSNPSDPGSRYYTEPLDPANLDRFVLQLKAEGAVQSERWDEAAQIVNLFCDTAHAAPESAAIPSGEAAEELRAASAAHMSTVVPKSVRRLLLRVLEELVTRHGVGPKNSLLTDRTFLVKALRVMRARAVLQGRSECIPEDIAVLQYLTTFRVPESVHSRIPRIVRTVLDKSNSKSSADAE